MRESEKCRIWTSTVEICVQKGHSIDVLNLAKEKFENTVIYSNMCQSRFAKDINNWFQVLFIVVFMNTRK